MNRMMMLSLLAAAPTTQNITSVNEKNCDDNYNKNTITTAENNTNSKTNMLLFQFEQQLGMARIGAVLILGGCCCFYAVFFIQPFFI